MDLTGTQHVSQTRGVRGEMEEDVCLNQQQQQKETFNWCLAVEKCWQPSCWSKVDRDTDAYRDEGVADSAIQTAIPECSRKPVALCGCRRAPWFRMAVLVPLAILIIIIVALAVSIVVEKSKPHLAGPGPPVVPCCPDSWIGYRGKCYYFSEAEGNWTYGQSQCSVFNASLAVIDSEQEKDFLLRYKGFLDRWIGLRKEPGQPWRWPNGTEFDQRFPIKGGGDCVFLMDEDWFGSSRCRTWRRWICSKLDAYLMGKRHAVGSKL